MHQDPTSLENLLHVFHRMHHGCMRAELERRGLRESGNPAILFVLGKWAKGEPVTQRQIADRLGVAPPTVAVSVKRMEKAGLLRKQADETDLRKTWISLTEEGAALIGELAAAEKVIYRRIIDGLSAQELEVMRGVYLRMIENMCAIGGRLPDSLKPCAAHPGKSDTKE